MPKKPIKNSRPIQTCDPLEQIKHFLKTWISVRDPDKKVRQKEDPLIESFWDFCARAGLELNDPQKEEVFADFITSKGAEGI